MVSRVVVNHFLLELLVRIQPYPPKFGGLLYCLSPSFFFAV